MQFGFDGGVGGSRRGRTDEAGGLCGPGPVLLRCHDGSPPQFALQLQDRGPDGFGYRRRYPVRGRVLPFPFGGERIVVVPLDAA